MPTRETELRRLTETVCEHPAVADAWLAKSFTDRLFVVDLADGERLPDDVRETLAANGLRGCNEVYGTASSDPSSVGAVGGGTRHRFVDVRSRDEHGTVGAE
ncbi:hypothetical protein [Halobaculum sp. D14]|uniref:hypothetical protein n=1 Tax=unclassified Halobaculum TaxID=2640896 RepID=UPI003EBFC82D